MTALPYSIPYKRALTLEERELLAFLLEREAPSRMSEIANYMGRDRQGTVVGVALLQRDGKLAGLEAWPPAGDDITLWPELSTLERAA